MTQTFKARLRTLRTLAEGFMNDFESLNADHQEWMDDHESGWENTPEGERAFDEQLDLECLNNNLVTLIEEIDELLEPKA